MNALVLFLIACGSKAPEPAGLPVSCEDGTTLFGQPNDSTGLSDAECNSTCTCEGSPWTAPVYGAEDIAALRSLTLDEPFEVLLDDPYAASPAPSADPERVCGVQDLGGGRYTLRTWPDRAALEAAGDRLTHTGPCGLCSTLEDLAVYIELPDLTAPVRACGLENMGGSAEEHRACLEALGFTPPCASIWYWNTRNTQAFCLSECLAALDAPYNQPDGSLNPCLQCDEDQSGPVFKAVAGRTRRNTGLPNAICRPCGEVTPIEHRYP